MPTQDTSEVKEKIISNIRSKGPLLPVQIAREIGISSLFISAYLSELISAKKLKVSKMKVGNSPLYYLPGQENLLENFVSHLKSQEKEALETLKENEVLKDSNLEPATRVALQSIGDFAIPFESSGEKYWRYMATSEQESLQKISEEDKEKTFNQEQFQQRSPEAETQQESKELDSYEKVQKNEIKDASERQSLETTEEKESSSQKNEESKFESPLKGTESEPETKSQENEYQELNNQKENQFRSTGTKKKTAKKSSSKKSSSDKTNKFFNKVKDHLSELGIEITDIVGIGKDELVLKINEYGNEKLLIAFNKNKIDEDDLVKAHKKASDFDMKYSVLSKNGALKKVENLLEAIQKMDSVKSMK